MIVGILYIVYFAVLIITFLVCYFLAKLISTCDFDVGFNNILIYLLMASIVALLVIFVSVIWVDTSNLSQPELIALNVLLLITFLLPIIIIVILVFMKEINNDQNKCCDNSSQNKCCDNLNQNKCCDNLNQNKCCNNNTEGITI